MEFLKRHYEKIVLCVVLLGLAAAAIWMKMAIDRVQTNLAPLPQPPKKGVALTPIDLSTDQVALAQVTNPPSIMLSGDHNLFNPVTWKMKSDGSLLKIIKTGSDALIVTKITKLYTIIGYDHASGQGSGVYVMSIQQHSDPEHPSRKTSEYAKKDEKMKSGLYILRNVEGDADDPTALQLELPDTGETVKVTKDKPYQFVDSYVADLRYDPDSKVFSKVHVNDVITLDDVQYKVVEITANAVRVQSNRTTKVTEIKWK
ncbi:MAG TPA: hypothetical protein VH595_19785 [Verrucomicrobiae bacterium]|jgi:hypothetical protein|nr:hypothetical protein [Verrucomicrobiae bacterium]